MGVHLATSLADALAAMATDPAAHVLAGGTDLMVEVNFGHRSPSAVIAIDRVPELRGWRRVDGPVGPGGALRLGAGLTYRDMLALDLAALGPALAEASRTVGSPQIRNAGTLAGNLGTCSPAGDGLPVLAALDATVTLLSASGVRSLPVGEFMVGVKRTAIEPGEMICEIEIPVRSGWQGYAKVGVRNA